MLLYDFPLSILSVSYPYSYPSYAIPHPPPHYHPVIVAYTFYTCVFHCPPSLTLCLSTFQGPFLVL